MIRKNILIQWLNDLKRQISKIWGRRKVFVVSIMIVALDALSKDISSWAAKIEEEEKINAIQKACVFGTTKIFTNVLDI